MGGKLKREAIYVYLQLIHAVAQQKLTHCKAIILQLKIKIIKVGSFGCIGTLSMLFSFQSISTTLPESAHVKESKREASFLKCKKTYSELLITPQSHTHMLQKLDSLNGKRIVLSPSLNLLVPLIL